MNDLSFSSRLISFRESKGLKQADFARKLEIFPQLLSRYEKGKAYPPYEFFKKIVELWPEANLSWLIGGIGEESNPKEYEILKCYRALGEGKKMLVEGYVKQKYGEELEEKG